MQRSDRIALKPINIATDEAQANLVIEHIEDDFAEDTLKYEDFLLQRLFEFVRKHKIQKMK